MRAPRAHRTRWPWLVGAGATALLATLVVAEIAARVLVPENRLPEPPAPRTVDPYEPNPYTASYRPYLQVFLPGARYEAARSSYAVDYEINARGFRGPEIGDGARGRRLLVVGDSIPEGHGVAFDEALPARLDRALAADGWSVVNASMQGGSPLHYAANLPRYLALGPDAVLLVLYENDLWDDRRKEGEYFDLPVLDEPGVLDGSSARGDELRLATLARRVLAPARDPELERRIRENRSVEPPRETPDPISAAVVGAASFDRQWTMSERYLDRFETVLRENEVPLLVTVFALGTLVPRLPAEHRAYALRLEDEARRWARARDLPFATLLPVAEEAFRTLPWEDVMLQDDGHPTSGIHRRLADALVPWLRSHLPPEPRAQDAAAARDAR